MAIAAVRAKLRKSETDFVTNYLANLDTRTGSDDFAGKAEEESSLVAFLVSILPMPAGGSSSESSNMERFTTSLGTVPEACR